MMKKLLFLGFVLLFATNVYALGDYHGNDVGISNSLTIGEDLTVSNNLSVANTADIGTLTLTNSYSGDLTITGNLSVAGTMSGDAVVQVALTQTGNLIASSATFPEDDTIPQISEGFFVMSKAITPKDVGNYLRIQATVSFTADISSNACFVTLAAFQDSTVNSIGASFTQASAATEEADHITLDFFMLAGTTSSTTISIRLGSDRAATHTINGLNGARYFGGVSMTTLIITEYQASDVDATLSS